jgi:hypothetical protein
MQTLYDTAGLAIVAYGEVLADGTSPNLNSGVTTGKTGTGQFTVTLPANKLQSGTRDLMFVTPKVSQTPANPIPFSHSVDDSDSAVKKVTIYGGSPLATFADAEFSFIIFRSLVTPPTGSPA